MLVKHTFRVETCVSIADAESRVRCGAQLGGQFPGFRGLGLPEERENALALLVGNAQGLDTQLLLDLEGLQPG